MQYSGLDSHLLAAVADQLGYNWVLVEAIQKRIHPDTCQPLCDGCLPDGAE